MNARQDWEKGTLVLKPQGKGDRPGQVIVYNMREGKQERLELETLEDESSMEDSSSTARGTSDGGKSHPTFKPLSRYFVYFYTGVCILRRAICSIIGTVYYQ